MIAEVGLAALWLAAALAALQLALGAIGLSRGQVMRLVLLPHESHAYEARESVEHVLWEMLHWFDKYVKRAPEPAVNTFTPSDLPPP